MTLPDPVREEVEALLGKVLAVREVGGGCVNPAARVEVPGGAVFVKYNLHPPGGMFEAEAEGLQELRAHAPSLRVPRVLGRGELWLALEWLERGPGGRAADEHLGRGLAELHGSQKEEWGWWRDGFIGPLPQGNQPRESWATFWREQRLEPQLALLGAGVEPPGGGRSWERLLAALPDLLGVAEEERPSILHGDLWGGNVMVTTGGEPALVDPATYHGHREVDLAMSELFGGFAQSFYSAYREVCPLAPGHDVRRGIYQLYYLLVHVNLFGGGYAARTERVLQDVLRSI